MNPQKKSLTFMKSKSVVLLALSLVMAGCSSSSSKNDPAGNRPLTGNWQMSLQPSNSKLKPNPQSGFLVQSSDAVTGSVSVTDAPCSGVAPVSGTVTGNTVSLTLSPSGIEVILDGNIDSGNTSMSGTYNILSTGCSGTETAPQSGTWTANQVSPINGTIIGTFTSKHTALPYSVTGMASQAANTGVSSVALTGNLSVNGYCFASATINGVVSGTDVVMNLIASDGSQIGQVQASSSLDGTILTGTYNILPLGSGNPPCGDGDSGTVSLTL
jgi:hypothetical protein